MRRHQTEGSESDELRKSPTMARLLDALESGEDIGHYGHFVFVTVARHFLSDEAIVALLSGQPEMTEERAQGMVRQIAEKGYNPPRREKILEMQAQQDYSIIPDPDNPDSGNLYRELSFPETIYEDINHYYEEKAGSASN